MDYALKTGVVLILVGAAWLFCHLAIYMPMKVLVPKARIALRWEESIGRVVGVTDTVRKRNGHSYTVHRTVITYNVTTGSTANVSTFNFTEVLGLPKQVGEDIALYYNPEHPEVTKLEGPIHHDIVLYGIVGGGFATFTLCLSCTLLAALVAKLAERQTQCQ